MSSAGQARAPGAAGPGLIERDADLGVLSAAIAGAGTTAARPPGT